MANTVAVVLLNAEGDQFNASLIADGQSGGQIASMLLYDRIKASLIKRNMTSSILVYFVADRLQSISLPKEKWEAFLSGFGKTKNPCFVIDPLDSSSSLRITQLLDLFLPLSSTATVYLGSLDTSKLYPYLITLPPLKKNKLTLLSTITVAPCYRTLEEKGWIKVERGVEGLFGELLMPEIAGRLWRGEEGEGEEEEKELRGKGKAKESENKEEKGRVELEEIWKETEESPVTSNSRRVIPSGLVWEVDSDDGNRDFSPGTNDEAIPTMTRRSTPLSLPIGTPRQSPPPQTPQPTRRSSSTPSDWEDRLDSEDSPILNSPRPEPHISTTSTPPAPHQPLDSSFSRALVLARPPQTTPSSSTALIHSPSPLDIVIPTPLGPISPLPPFPQPALSFTHSPGPCKLFYVRPSSCPKSSQTCKFSHTYPFTRRELEMFPLWVKGTICIDHTKGRCKRGDKGCKFGHRCPWTIHTCPYGSTCKFREKGLPHSSRGGK